MTVFTSISLGSDHKHFHVIADEKHDNTLAAIETKGSCLSGEPDAKSYPDAKVLIYPGHKHLTKDGRQTNIAIIPGPHSHVLK